MSHTGHLTTGAQCVIIAESMGDHDMSDKAPLPDYFRAESKGKNWHLFCKRCEQGWSLPKDNNHPGNMLHLLNHARGHDED